MTSSAGPNTRNVSVPPSPGSSFVVPTRYQKYVNLVVVPSFLCIFLAYLLFSIDFRNAWSGIPWRMHSWVDKATCAVITPSHVVYGLHCMPAVSPLKDRR